MITDEEYAAFLDAAHILCLLKGPRLPREIWQFADLDNDTGTYAYIKAVTSEPPELIGCAMDRDGFTLYRPPHSTDVIVKCGQLHLTPNIAVALQARNDQDDAEMRDMTPEDWAEVERLMGE